MSDLRRSDAEARELAVREFTRPLALEAGAGTGKTRTLVARLATWLLAPGWDEAAAELEAARAAGRQVATDAAAVAAAVAERVVAITFTDAAAAEMSSRIARLFAALAAGGDPKDLEPRPAGLDPDQAAQRARALAASLGRLRIQTIHAFCFRLLSEHPFEAGLHPSLSIDSDDERLERAATEALRGRLRQRSGPLVELIAEGVDPLSLLDALIGLYADGATPADLETPRFDGAVATDVARRLGAGLDALLPALRSLTSSIGRRVKTLGAALESLEGLRAAVDSPHGFGLDRLEELAESVRDRPKAVGTVLDRWSGAEPLTRTEAEALGADAELLREPAARLGELLEEVAVLQPRRFEVARQALRGLLEEVRARLRRDGVLTFEDLLARAVELLERDRGLRDRLRRGIRQLLVDEFQDTDARQCRLIELLVLEPGASAPGLFLVGDPKQSIYAFRHADLASYERLLSRLDAAGGMRAPLAVNFRSAAPLLGEFERVIEPVMRAEPGVQPAFVPLLASPEKKVEGGFARAGRRPVEYWVSWAQGGERDRIQAAQAAELEAGAIAGDILDLHRGEGCRWSSFALLLRARGDLEIYLDALRRAGIPFEVQKDRSYFQRREVIDLACAVRAILDPADLLALVAYLRSPLVGVPDSAWIPLWSAGFAAAVAELEGPDPERLGQLGERIRRAAEATPRAAPGADAVAGWPAALLDAVEAIADLRATFARVPPEAWIERLRLRLLPEPIAAARYLGRFGLANVERLLADLEAALAEAVEPSRALAVLSRALAERREAEEARPPGAERDAVAVLTIHAAKGLEFDHVYLPQTHKQPGREPAVPAHDVLPAPPGASGAGREVVLLGAPSPGWWRASVQRREARRAETVRLLYVAMTRARERLVVCGTWAAAVQTVERPRSFLDLMEGRRAGDFDPARLAEGFEDDSGALWRLCELSRAASVPAHPEVEPVADSEAPGRRTDRRRAARARQSRARIAAVSAVAAPGESGAEADRGSDTVAARARELGSALHRALEQLDPSTVDDGESLTETGSATDLVAERLGRFRRGPLGARFRALADHLLARELPLLVAADPDATSGPSGALVGALDLLYRDPVDGRLVVADFKSDTIPEEALAARIERYSTQLRIYGDAVRRALGEEREPRLELWFLALDRVVEIPSRTDRPTDSG